jgi:large subunit ribosomal protein L5e
MAFVKVIKNRSYFIRYQVKYRRRREGKTDYQARRRLIMQDKNKYNSPKYRLVVRFTNRDVVAQMVRAKIEGDFVYAAAYGHELTKYGIPVGHSNYASAYAVGLLLARRTLKKFGLADKYQGQTTVTGEDYNVEPIADGPRPLRAVLDTGLKRTSTGSRVFATLKGAVDGGIDIPHSVSRYVGYDGEGKKLKADVLREHIFGGHVAEHMRQLKDDDQATFERKFSKYIKNKITADDVEKLYAKAHASIRADPTPAPKKATPAGAKHKRFNKVKLTRAGRIANIKQKKAVLIARAKAESGADDDEDEEADE